MDDERLKILNMLQSGQIDARQAADLLTALKAEQDAVPAGDAHAAAPAVPASPEPGAGTGAGPEPEVLPPQAAPPARPDDRWARFWIYPLLAGGGILLLGSLVMGLVSAAHPAWRLCCGWFPLLLGALVMLLAWWSRRAKWLHVRVNEPGQRKVAISFPLPLTLAAWVLRIVQPFIPQLKDTGVDDLIIAMRDNPHGEPIAISVDEEDGENVQVYIG